MTGIDSPMIFFWYFHPYSYGLCIENNHFQSYKKLFFYTVQKVAIPNIPTTSCKQHLFIEQDQKRKVFKGNFFLINWQVVTKICWRGDEIMTPWRNWKVRRCWKYMDTICDWISVENLFLWSTLSGSASSCFSYAMILRKVSIRPK